MFEECFYIINSILHAFIDDLGPGLYTVLSIDTVQACTSVLVCKAICMYGNEYRSHTVQ